MKLITYDTANGPRAGVVVDGQVLDIASLLNERDTLRDIRALLELPNEPLRRLKSALGSAHATLGIPLGKVRLRAPILQPPTVRDFMTYEGHEQAAPWPSVDLLQRFCIRPSARKWTEHRQLVGRVFSAFAGSAE
jgi:hypothetical protein